MGQAQGQKRNDQFWREILYALCSFKSVRIPSVFFAFWTWALPALRGRGVLGEFAGGDLERHRVAGCERGCGRDGFFAGCSSTFFSMELITVHAIIVAGFVVRMNKWVKEYSELDWLGLAYVASWLGRIASILYKEHRMPIHRPVEWGRAGHGYFFVVQVGK